MCLVSALWRRGATRPSDGCLAKQSSLWIALNFVMIGLRNVNEKPLWRTHGHEVRGKVTTVRSSNCFARTSCQSAKPGPDLVPGGQPLRRQQDFILSVKLVVLVRLSERPRFRAVHR